MQIHCKSEFVRTPVLENRAFFTCVQCRYCGYLILGGSGKELLEEKGRHAIECKATHCLMGAGQRARRQKPRIGRDTRVLKWSRAVLIGMARLCAILARLQSLKHRPVYRAQHSPAREPLERHPNIRIGRAAK
jgi:hypothetical protein